MNSVEHAVLGTVAAGVGVAALAEAYPPLVLTALFVAGVGVSVFVDLDHFVIARWAAGDWSHLRRVFAAPTRAFSEPGYVFPDLEFPWLRLASHVVIATILGLAAATVDTRLAAFFVGVFAVHVLADLLRDQELL
jgi:hypothetical protein